MRMDEWRNGGWVWVPVEALTWGPEWTLKVDGWSVKA